MLASTIEFNAVAGPAPATVMAALTAATRNVVLLIGADAASRGALAEFLAAQNFRVIEASGRADAVPLLATETIDLVVLDDASLYDGLGLCRDLAATVGAPIVMIADCQDQTDRIIALEVGADEILARPCHNRELLARARALLRRSGRTGSAEMTSRSDGGGWLLNDALRLFRSPSGRETALTPLEHRLLRAFMDAQGQIMDRTTVAEAFGPGALVCHSNFRTCMCRLRRKLGKDASGADVLRTIRGKGYVLSVPIQLH